MTEQRAHGLTDAEVARFVAETRTAQGLPPHVEDPATLDWIAGLLTAAIDQPET